MRKERVPFPLLKKIFLGVLLICLGGLIVRPASTAWGTNQTVVFSGHPEYPPFAWRQDGSVVGVGPDLVRYVFDELGIPIQIPYLGSWAEILEKARRGEIDGVAGLYYTDERTTDLVYSIPFAQDPVTAFVLKGKEFPLDSWDTLIGKRGVTTLGDSYGQTFDTFIDDHLSMERVDNVRSSFRKLIRQEADYFIYAFHAGLSEAARMNLGDSIAFLAPFIAVNNWHIAFSKSSPFLPYLPQVNSLIDRLVQEHVVELWISRHIDLYKVSDEPE